MSLLNKLDDKSAWENFLSYKKKNMPQNCRFIKRLEKFVAQEDYHTIAKSIISGNYQFDYPVKTLINKSGTTKKRVIYKFSYLETFLLKLLAHLLYKYDFKLTKACYSFRKFKTAHSALKDILLVKNIAQKYILKIDIQNYFNSIPSQKLVDTIEKIVDDDFILCKFLSSIISTNKAYFFENEQKIIIEENRGAMAGVPISAFFANFYLNDLDCLFIDKNVDYFRYSDDILVICNSMEEVVDYKNIITKFIVKKGLTINSEKLKICQPNQPWEFLGFSFYNQTIDLAQSTITKIKKKIKRKSKSLMRRRTRYGESFDMVASDLADHFNRKFYDQEHENNFTWSRWFFPMLTTVKSLKTIDNYLQQYMSGCI